MYEYIEETKSHPWKKKKKEEEKEEKKEKAEEEKEEKKEKEEEEECSSPCSNIPIHVLLYCSLIHFNIILPSTPVFFKRSLCVSLLHHNYYTSRL